MYRQIMAESRHPPEFPPSHYFLASYDEQGDYKLKPLGYRADEEGNRMPFFRLGEEHMSLLRNRIEGLRQGKRQQILDALAEVPQVDGSEFNVDRIDNFYRALGLPTAQAIVVERATDLPTTGPARHISKDFLANPMVGGQYFPSPRLIVALNNMAVDAKPKKEQILAHEKAHSTGQDTVILPIDGKGDIDTQAVRVGFRVGTPRRGHTRLSGIIEESQADMFAATYARLFLSCGDVMSIPHPVRGKMEIDARYSSDDQGKHLSINTLSAIAIELMVEREPQLFEHLIAARLSLRGLRQFAQSVNTLVPGFYRNMSNADGGWESHLKMLESVVNTLYEGDYDVTKKTGNVISTLVMQKLRAYEEQTGYNFGLPASVAQGAVLLEPRPAATITKPAGQNDSSAHTSDDITNLLNQVRSTL
jgi:hypothetical protein